ncbi:hypothetical protein Bca52824_039322 [Brassica carinata]|uniref:Reverse transcriptase zinc-binding domain-containing protein n=1 Tax=Brassica carinata TaxID=52824 RepID=A0A8X7RST6_BRACI|nr:hypothetical protein Bca52824_039322 [Brassica carinata]
MNDLEVRDLRYHGPIFTWSNKQPSSPISKKLDRILVNESWILSYPASLAHYLAPDFSDHSPGLVNLNCSLPIAGTKPFKFFNYLTGHPEFLSSVTSGWSLSVPTGWSLSSLSKKQKALKQVLKALNKNNFSGIQKLIIALSNPSEVAFLEEKLCREKLLMLKGVEEAYFHQKSRIQWLKLGDQNTSFFFKVSVSRNFFNAIHALTDLNGITHFKQILGPPLSLVVPGLLETIQVLSPFSCSDMERSALCRTSKLTHLCFADDLLIFTDGSLNSMQGSVEKSCFFSAGLNTLETSALVNSTGISQGSLPMRYLGLPLSTKKLSLLNCEPLLQKIKAKINIWTAKYLSFAGRLQMISSVISGIINFWCAAFVLPVECINQINSLCAAYLWKGSLDGRYNARVAWDSVTTPKSEGGLGLKNIRIWNRTCLLKLLWMLFFKQESIWSAWIQDNVIKDSSFWNLKEHQSHTWIFKQILESNLASQWLRIIPGNGISCHFWTTPWSPFGPLLSYIGPQGPRQAGIPLNSTLASLWNGHSWRISPARSSEMEALHIHLTSLVLSTAPDTPTWNASSSLVAASNKFISSQVYNLLRETRPLVPWRNIVWLKRGIPKHKLQTWLFTLNRCPTMDRLITWGFKLIRYIDYLGIQTDSVCLLCNSLPESRDHIFFDCNFSDLVWGPIASKLRFNGPSGWSDTIAALLSLSGDKHLRYLTILAWQITIYELWRERNHRLHRQRFSAPETIINTIQLTIKNRIQSFREANPLDSSACMQLWFSFRLFIGVFRFGRRRRLIDARLRPGLL